MFKFLKRLFTKDEFLFMDYLRPGIDYSEVELKMKIKRIKDEIVNREKREALINSLSPIDLKVVQNISKWNYISLEDAYRFLKEIREANAEKPIQTISSIIKGWFRW